MVRIVGGMLWLGIIVLAGCTCGGADPRPQPAGAPAERSGVAAPPPGSDNSRQPLRADGDDPPAAQKLRRQLVRQITTLDKPWGGAEGWESRVVDVMSAVPRHLFVPEVSTVQAYQDTPQLIGHGQTISQPTIVALMSQALSLTTEHRVLEIGTGSGYQAAVLSVLAKHVYSIEIIPELGNSARERLKRLHYLNVTVRVGDGYKGWPEHAPFDRIVLTAAPPEIPRALIDQLVDGGILVAPVGEREQVLVRWIKRGGAMEKEELGLVRFVPMVRGDR